MTRITMPGTLDSLDEIGVFVIGSATKAGLDKTKSYRLRLAVDEIATNAIIHGYQEAGRVGDIRIESEMSDTKLTIRLYDDGDEYDPGEIADPGDLKRPLEERPIGGLGVFLSIQSVDKFSYERSDGINCHTFVMNKE
jgi:anti-sigma regulatory factor (Ser/Thr protein kinase)